MKNLIIKHNLVRMGQLSVVVTLTILTFVELTFAQGISAILVDATVQRIIKFVLSAAAVIKIFGVLQNLIDGQSENLIKNLMGIAIAIYLAISYEKIVNALVTFGN